MTRHISALVRMILNTIVWLETGLYHGAATLYRWRDSVQAVEREMVPTWRETVWPLCMAVLAILVVYFLILVGED